LEFRVDSHPIFHYFIREFCPIELGQSNFMATVKNIGILGSTGSIGRSSLEVIANFPDRFRVRYLTAKKNTKLLHKQIRKFHPEAVAVADYASAIELKRAVNGSIKIFVGDEGVREIASQKDTDIVINALVGFAGLHPTLDAIKLGKTVALANKETLVVGGELITKSLKKYGAKLIPIDSEHSAILQCLTGEKTENIRQLILTASGGPFRTMEKNRFKHVTVREALNHPNWKMGSKITIDSATLMNKGLEVIEAYWLFGLPPEKIDVVIHPQSIIHSMVEFVDGSVKAQLGIPDMKIPIQYALTYPDRAPSKFARVDFVRLGTITFLKPDKKKFRCLALAYDALATGGTAPAILNAANEVAVHLFLNGIITFDRIPKIIRNALQNVPVDTSPSLNNIMDADAETRAFVNSLYKHHD